jgi:hypothetical protein
MAFRILLIKLGDEQLKEVFGTIWSLLITSMVLLSLGYLTQLR